ncbi:hypothetical protein BBK82_09935 [Lentzea guizhouensis]|uniref:Chaplin domain-containing protein n=1 Tax=Lentzea guizhouensis TaxID=1586287 RepID=A0A1B2HF62_9PSEU|nr:hypothetical protein [Lentzea guizhouensis]ANZ36335.1 hypothetical protein BBK82_09935 [Lentzea guizhouensis]
MLKKTAAAVAAAAALTLAIAPAALAGEGHGHGHGHGDGHSHGGGHGHHWYNGGLLSALNGNNVNATVGACGNNVGVLGAAVPINSPSITGTCAAGGIVDEG